MGKGEQEPASRSDVNKLEVAISFKFLVEIRASSLRPQLPLDQVSDSELSSSFRRMLRPICMIMMTWLGKAVTFSPALLP